MPLIADQASVFAHVGESTVTLVVIELEPSHRGNQQITVSVVVVIRARDSYRHGVRISDPQFLGDVCERAITVIAIEGV